LSFPGEGDASKAGCPLSALGASAMLRLPARSFAAFAAVAGAHAIAGGSRPLGKEAVSARRAASEAPPYRSPPSCYDKRLGSGKEALVRDEVAAVPGRFFLGGL
jgi:hypothetical protein